MPLIVRSALPAEETAVAALCDDDPFALALQVGEKRAREIWLLCRRYSAQQALDWGLANAVVPMADLDREVRKWCDEMLALSPTSLKVLKRTFDQEFAQLREFQDSEDYLQDVNPTFFESGEQDEGAQAFLEKRQPDFSRWR